MRRHKTVDLVAVLFLSFLIVSTTSCFSSSTSETQIPSREALLGQTPQTAKPPPEEPRAEPVYKIAFVSNRDGNWEIYIMEPDGKNQKRLTRNPFSDAFLAWSPDGKKVAFTSNRDGNEEIYTMDADGSNQRRLTDNSYNEGMPSWSPDGSEITFASDRDGNLEIYVINADGSNQRRLTNNRASDATPAWSPDGNKIAFSSNRDGRWGIYVMEPDGTNQKRLTSSTATTSMLSWSPDCSRIIYSSEYDGKYAIYTIDADGKNQKRFTSNIYDDGLPAWSPDGKMIAFTSTRDGNEEIYIMDADGSHQRRLTDNPAMDRWPAWQPVKSMPLLPPPSSTLQSASSAPPPKGNLLFYDDFGSLDSGWARGTTKFGKVDYENGELSVEVNETYTWTGSAFTAAPPENFMAEFDTRKISGDNNAACGLIFSAFEEQGELSFYAFWISSDGQYSISKVSKGNWSTVKDWTYSNYIKTGPVVNKIGVVCKQIKLEVYVNGQKLDTVTDTAFPLGGILLAAHSKAKNGSHYHFDNFRLYAVEAGGDYDE